MPFVGPVALALPAHQSQAALRDVAAAVAGDRTMLRVFESARIDTRPLAMPLAWYLEPHGLQARNDAYLEVGTTLAEQAARQALAEAGLAATDLTGILFVSTTGMATPSLDARLAQRLGCRADVQRMPAWGWGCAGGVAGINRAAQMVGDGHVLVVCLELCTLQFDRARALRVDPEGKKALVAASLFSDGCAAVVVSGQASGKPWLEHVGAASHLFPDSERVMGWDVHDDHLEVVLSPRIPQIVEQEVPDVLGAWLDGRRVDHWVLHPGGHRVVEAFVSGLGLQEGDVAATRSVLARHGNMSSPTVLAVLDERRREPGIRSGQTALLAALGPGFALEACLLRAP